MATRRKARRLAQRRRRRRQRPPTATRPPPPPPPPRPPRVATIYVGNLAPTVDELALIIPFHYFGPVTGISIIHDKVTNTSRGFAFLSYALPASAAAAVARMNGVTVGGPFEGRALKVGPSTRAAKGGKTGDDDAAADADDTTADEAAVEPPALAAAAPAPATTLAE